MRSHILGRYQPQISLLVPYQSDHEAPSREESWDWLRQYWSYELPDAEIVIGHSTGVPFSKTEAVNDAALRARGRIFVILDSDTYIRGTIVQRAADLIDEALRHDRRLWLIPFRRLYRLTNVASMMVLNSDPRDPYRFTTPPDPDDVESMLGSAHGHHFGAMIQVMPREAFELVGGMDLRFRGWGGEDVAFVRALDTLYVKHKTLSHDVLHLWHEKQGDTHDTRVWSDQEGPRANETLANRYNLATGDRVRMRRLVDEGQPDLSLLEKAVRLIHKLIATL